MVAPTSDNLGQERSNPVLPFTGDDRNTLAASVIPVNEKGRLSTGDNRPSCRGERIRTSDLLNPIQEPTQPNVLSDQDVTSSDANCCTIGCTSEAKTAQPDVVATLAAALLAMTPADRARLTAILLGVGEK